MRRLVPSPRWWLAAAAALPFFVRPGGAVAQATAPPPDDGRIAAFEAGLRAPADEDTGERWTLAERMALYGVPGVSVAVVRDGRVAWARGWGVKRAGPDGEPIDAGTVFSVGSVSKVGAAATTLRLVDQGRLDLDRDVNEYLTRWDVPENDLTRQEPVTLRRIMSHTAGLTVHGFADYQPDEALPSVVDILEGRAPAKSPPVRVDLLPGSRFRYSGGGTTVEQLVVEEVTGTDFPTAARTLVFEPLGMSRSTYVNPLPESHGNTARAHGPDGAPRALPRGWEAMPEAAASGLWTTPSDFARLMLALMEAWHGEDDAFLSPELVRDMMSAEANSEYGLGPELETLDGEIVFRHGGANDSYRAFFVGFLEGRDGAVVFTNGTRGNELIAEIVRSLRDAEGWPGQ